MPEGEVGEICVAGPQVMKSYWRNKEATNDSFINGWFRTGDAGYLNDGYFVYPRSGKRHGHKRGREHLSR